MKKRMGLNNKGFVLAETLVVTVAVAAIFTIMFKNFYPLLGEYERREEYDDIDSKYGTYWIKRLIQSRDFRLNASQLDSQIRTNGGYRFSCADITDNAKQIMCYQLITSLEISCDNPSTKDAIERCDYNDYKNNSQIYITRYQMKTDAFGDVKPKLTSKFSIMSDQMKDYINYLPYYSKVGSLNKAQYRVIIEYYRHRFDTEGNEKTYVVDTDNDYRTFSTIEVKK